MSGFLIGYARVSTDEQDLTAQRDGLARLGVEPERIYVAVRRPVERTPGPPAAPIRAIRTSIALPARGGGSPAAHKRPSSGGVRCAERPSLPSRRTW
jgi:hypothetical protein